MSGELTLTGTVERVSEHHGEGVGACRARMTPLPSGNEADVAGAGREGPRPSALGY